MDDKAWRLAALYAGRSDIYGAVHGQAIREDPMAGGAWTEHVHGAGSVGIYPLLDNGTVKWGAVDIDLGYDLIAVAANVWRALKALGIVAYVEKSKGKGFHVIAFGASWMLASVVRNALLFACQVVDYSPREVYPKQTSLEPGQVGNYLNAAYAKKWVAEGKRVILDMHRTDRCPLSLDEFLERVQLNGVECFVTAAAHYVPPPPKQVVQLSEYKGGLDHLVKRMNGLAWTIWSDGPKPTEKMDRSFEVFRFASILAKDGQHTPSEALALVTTFDERWTQKFSERADGALQLQRVIERAFG